MDEKKVLQFKGLFSEYCRGEVDAGRCNDTLCAACPVGLAWERIFGDEDPEFED